MQKPRSVDDQLTTDNLYASSVARGDHRCELRAIAPFTGEGIRDLESTSALMLRVLHEVNARAGSRSTYTIVI